MAASGRLPCLQAWICTCCPSSFSSSWFSAVKEPCADPWCFSQKSERSGKAHWACTPANRPYRFSLKLMWWDVCLGSMASPVCYSSELSHSTKAVCCSALVPYIHCRIAEAGRVFPLCSPVHQRACSFKHCCDILKPFLQRLDTALRAMDCSVPFLLYEIMSLEKAH